MSIRDKVNVESTGQIYGEVITGKFVIDEESIFQGNCIMNRDGKKIPVTPYNPNGDKEEEKKEETKDNTAEKNEPRSRKKNRRINKTAQKKNSSVEKKEEVKADPQEELDSEIEISDIDDLESETAKPEVKKIKSLNVEIED